MAGMWLAAAGDDKARQRAHGSTSAKVEYDAGQQARLHLTDSVTIQPGTPVQQAAKQLAVLLQKIAGNCAGGDGQFSIVLKLAGRDGKISSAEAMHTITVQTMQVGKT
jgi:hypothetical protein